MNRKTFLTISSLIALGVGLFALCAPALLLQSKGVDVNAGTTIWVREVGVMLIAVGITVFMVRNHVDSPTLKAVLLGNVVVQLGLLVIEPLAYSAGIITKLAGIAPNTMIHVLLAFGFCYFASKIRL
ncbi:MAG: hypothetical protein RJB10_1074 [Pseudomonadota bacterium]|jgi:hypothetical protein